MSTYLDFLNGLKEKRNPNATQINGVYVRFINDNKASTQDNLDQKSRGLFISQLNNNDVFIEPDSTPVNYDDNNNSVVEPNDINNDDNNNSIVEPNDVNNYDNNNSIVEPNVVNNDIKKIRKPRQKKDNDNTDNNANDKRDEPRELPQIIMNNQNYYMNNRKRFVENIGKMLHHYSDEIESKQGTISCKNQGSGKFETLVHQRVVLDYLNLNTPYRGLLLYHGLGSGKTCTAIAIAEGMKSRSNVIVMTPASLQTNFVSELKKCGDPLYKKLQYWEFIDYNVENDKMIKELSKELSVPLDYVVKKKGIWRGTSDKESNFATKKEAEQKQIDAQLKLMIQSKYTNLNYNGGIKPKLLKEMTNDNTKNPFDNSVVIIDEAHNFVSRIVNKLPKNVTVKGKGKAKDSLDKFNKSMSGKLYNYLMDATNVRIVLLTGTPIINYPNEIGILFNIIRGTIKSWEFDLEINTTNKINRDTILDMFETDGFVDHDFVSYSNNKLIITRNPSGFVNKKQPVRGKNVRVGGTKRANKIHNNLTRKIVKSKVDNMLLPQMEYPDREIQNGGDGAFSEYSGVALNPNSTMTDELFLKRVKGILRKNDIVSQKDTIVVHKCLPDISEVFMKEFIDIQTGNLRNENLFKRRILGMTSYFRSAQENLLPRYEMSDTGKIYHPVLCEMSDFQIDVYNKVRKAEAKSEENKRKNEARNVGKNAEDILTIPSTYRIFSRACCNFAFPGGELERPRPDKVVFDGKNENGEENGEENEEENGEVDMDALQMVIVGEIDDDREDDDNEDQDENTEEAAAMRRLKRKPAKENKPGEEIPYEKKINEVMEKLRNPQYLGSSGLSTYSPKFSKILENIIDPKNIGLHLLYSNFRTIEGVGILKMILEMNGYAEFKLKKTKTWEIDEKVEDANKPKFVLYTGTESTEEKEIVRNVYNGSWDLVPATIARKLMAKSPETKNMYGDIIKVLMITSSGAEGINLKNTRYVHIVEPYWHMVRVQQVIGRARRICSHEELPIELQTIKVFIYITTYSAKQKKSEDYKVLHLIDRSKINSEEIVTTDESLFEMAERKDRINQKLLDAVKSSAIDCKLYNKSGSGYLCYTANGDNNNFLTIPEIGKDKNDTNEIEQNIKNIVLFGLQEIKYTHNGQITTYYLNRRNNEIFDVNEVKDSEARNDNHNLKPIGRLDREKIILYNK
jgi:hypothetical protein